MIHQFQGDQVGAFSLALLEALRRGAAPFTVSELTLPDATVLRWANRPVALPKHYSVRAKFGEVVEQVDPLATGVALPSMQVELADDDAEFHKVTAEYAERLKGSPFDCLIGAVGVRESDWYLHFHGVLAAWPQVSPGKYQLTFRVDDERMRAKLGASISAGLWPNAEQDAKGVFYPWVYGTHDSVQVGVGGMLPTHRVDIQGSRFIVSGGRLSSIPRVYGADRALIASGFAVTSALDGEGRRVQLVDFTGSQAGPVYVDAVGLTEKPDGTGAVIDRPGRIVRHFLDNVVYGGFRDQATWLTGLAPVDVDSFAAADEYAARKDQVAAVVLGGRKEPLTGLEVAEQAAASYGLRVHWTRRGLLAVAWIDHEAQRYYDLPHLEDRHVMEMVEQQETERIYTELGVDFLFSVAENKYIGRATVHDVSAGDAITETTTQPWGPGEA